jgi:glyoxylase-like metal-dependent hydrolase (beta-lactamase superfamily II)
MTGHPHAQAHPPGTPVTQVPEDLAGRLLAASDEELAAILAAADQADIAVHQPGGLPVGGPVSRAAPGTAEIMLLGALGCRYGMLAGGAGGYLLRTPATTVLVDPGPAAHAILTGLNGSLFSWGELDAIVCTHFHPDHYAGIIPCLEAMASHAVPDQRKTLAANPTAAAKFAAFSPYHVGGMADLVALAHPATDGDGESSVKVGDLVIHAVPAAHAEEPGRMHSAIGLVFDTPAGGIWHTSDTTLADGLLDAVADVVPGLGLVVAHADASNIGTDPGRATVCHLQTRDVLPIASILRPRHVLIQHYDAAYSTPDYRIAQAIWLQRQLDVQELPTQVLPGVSGLRLTLSPSGIRDWDIFLESSVAPAISSYLRSALGGN